MRLPGHDLMRHTRRRAVAAPRRAATSDEAAVRLADLEGYRAAVAELLTELACRPGLDATVLEAILVDRIDADAFTTVLSRTPDGAAQATQRLLTELRRHGAGARRAEPDPLILIRTFLLSRIDALWWGREPAFRTDLQVLRASNLVDLAPLRRRGQLRFDYRRQHRVPFVPGTGPGPRPWTGGGPGIPRMCFARTRPEVVALLNQCAAEFDRVRPRPGPSLRVTGLVRSARQQRRSRTVSYPATAPSSHCVGYGLDIDMAWLRQFDAYGALAMVLLERQRAGDVNVIDEGRTWHVCVSPTALPTLRSEFDAELGGYVGAPA